MNPPWITFYSVRGGVGRSTALVLSALHLAQQGHRVAVVDFDLESPGLDILLPPTDGRPEDEVHRGVVDFLDARARGEPFEIEDIILPRTLPGDYQGRLFLVPAGGCDDTYLAAMDRLDLRGLYERSGLLNPVRALRKELEEVLEPDVVLVDSRTGYSDAALVTLFDLADAAVVVLLPDLQNVERLIPVLRRLVGSPKRELILAANKCQMTSPALRAIADIEDRLREQVPPSDEEDEEERPFLHKLPFDGALPWVQRLLPPPGLSDAQRALGKRLDGLIRELQQPPAISASPAPVNEALPEQRTRLLGRLKFGEERSEDDDLLLDAFSFAPKVVEALRPERWLIRGRKGAGKSAIFRMLTQRPDEARKRCPELAGWQIVGAHGDGSLGEERRYLRAEDFKHVHGLVQAGTTTWKDLWRLYVVCQTVRKFPELATTDLQREAARLLDVPMSERPQRLNALLQAGAHAWLEEIQRLPGTGNHRLLLVYDHLDAGFGSETRDFELRREAVTGLLDAWAADINLTQPRLLPKLLLREDVFKSLALANINRWRARDVELHWSFAELAGALAKRASMDQELAAYLDEHVKSLRHIESPETRLFVVLFDERVRPWEKQARTWLTASNRLTDVAGNLFPRDFVRLGGESLKLEKQEPTTRRAFEPALMAGSHMLAALPKVSERRASDLKDEFPEYSVLLDRLQGMRSPFKEADLKRRISALTSEAQPKEALFLEALQRLKDNGVIGDWGDGRLFVPDLYLRGLGMYRSGW